MKLKLFQKIREATTEKFHHIITNWNGNKKQYNKREKRNEDLGEMSINDFIK